MITKARSEATREQGRPLSMAVLLMAIQDRGPQGGHHDGPGESNPQQLEAGQAPEGPRCKPRILGRQPGVQEGEEIRRRIDPADEEESRRLRRRPARCLRWRTEWARPCSGDQHEDAPRPAQGALVGVRNHRRWAGLQAVGGGWI